MTVAKILELSSDSTSSFDDAIRQGVERARKTLKNVQSAWVKDQVVLLDDAGKPSKYRVHLKVTFALDE